MNDPMTNNIKVLLRLRERLVRINKDTDGDNHINESYDALDELDAALAAIGATQQAEADDNEFFVVPEGLHPNTTNLVARFATALAEKLAAAERKYGYSDNWERPDWMDECRRKLVEHTAKGDPRDVAAYCAFLWHHGESTTPQQPAAVPVGVEWPLSLLRAEHWREVYIGHRCMRLEVTYDYATWERLMAEVESTLAQQPAAVVDGWRLVIRYGEYDTEPSVWAEKDGSFVRVAALNPTYDQEKARG